MNRSTQTNPDVPIIYEDKYLLILDKPSGLLSQKDHTNDPDLISVCRRYLRKKDNTKNPFVALPHRLDRPVSGLIIAVKSRNAAGKLSAMFRDQTIDKTYWAVVKGKPSSNGYLEHYLIKNSGKNIVTAYHKPRKEAQKAMLSFQRLDYQVEQDASLLSIHLLTGRSHQIRVQLSAENFPILGDKKYHNAGNNTLNQIALKSVALRFTHPFSNEEIFQCSLPETAIPWSYFNVKQYSLCL